MDKHHDHYRWFTNRECEYYPCHEFAEINCLFCFCPLYFNDGCGGEYTILKSGIKDCSGCMIPHTAEGYDQDRRKAEGNRAGQNRNRSKRQIKQKAGTIRAFGRKSEIAGFRHHGA